MTTIKPTPLVLSLLASLLITAATPAFAITVTGGVDPATGLAALLPYALQLGGLIICGICAVKGVHAVHEGRSLGPHIFAAVGGTALTFGASYLLGKYGIT